MSEFDQLRAEFRQDRSELTRLLIDRFDKLDEKIGDSTVQLDDKISGTITSMALLEGRTKVVEDRMNTFGKGLWGLFLAMAGSGIAWLRGH